MSEKLTRLKHLQSALLETKNQIAEGAGAAADAIEEVAANVVTSEQIRDIVWEVLAELSAMPAGSMSHNGGTYDTD